MKIQLNYDPSTGKITANSGEFLFAWMGLRDHEIVQHELKSTSNIDEIIKLKTAGFNADEIIELSKSRLI